MGAVLVGASVVGFVGLASGPQAGAAGPDPAGTIYVSDESTNSIDVFAAGTNGDVAPIRTISGSNTGITGPYGPDDVKVNPAGDIFSSNFDSDSITEYAPGASGNVAPICTIAGSNTGLDENDDISLASDGTLYVGNFAGSDPVEVFAPGACGNVAPIRVIAGTLTGPLTLVDGLGVDAAGNLYVDNTNGGTIEVFAPGANGNVAPIRTLAGATTGLSAPDDVVVGFNGEIYVTQGFGSGTDGVLVFAPGANGNVAPIQNISGSNTDFGNPDDLAVDASGNIYVTDEQSSLGPAVLEYASGANGNVAPIASITGTTTTLVGPEGVAVAGTPMAASASLTSAASASTITLGSPTHDSATLSGGTTPSGSLIFKLFGPGDSTCSAAPAYTSPLTNVTGDGTYVSPSFVPTTAGTYSWVDLYSGDTHNAPVSTACGDPAETVTVSKSTTKATDTVTLHFGAAPTYGPQSPVAPGTNIELEATVNPNGVTDPGPSVTAPSGTITFYDGSTALKTVSGVGFDGSGYGADSTSSLATGIHEITAVYNGDTNYPTSTSNQVQVTVGVISTATSTPTTVGLDFGSAPTYTEQSPVPSGNNEVFSATVSPNGIVNPGPSVVAPTGTVSFFDGTTLLGTAPLTAHEGSSYASLPTKTLPAGSNEITAHYNGDLTHPASTSNQVQVTVS